MFADYKFNTIFSPVAKLNIDKMDEKHFNIHARGKSLRDKTLINNYFNKRSILASGLRTIFLSKKLNEFCNKLKILLQEKRVGNNSNRYKEEILAIFDKLLEYKCITAIQQQKIFK